MNFYFYPGCCSLLKNSDPTTITPDICLKCFLFFGKISEQIWISMFPMTHSLDMFCFFCRWPFSIGGCSGTTPITLQQKQHYNIIIEPSNSRRTLHNINNTQRHRRTTQEICLKDQQPGDSYQQLFREYLHVIIVSQ